LIANVATLAPCGYSNKSDLLAVARTLVAMSVMEALEAPMGAARLMGVVGPEGILNVHDPEACLMPIKPNLPP
jgi:hypothetical protein